MRNKHYKTWNMARNSENYKYEKQFRTWIVARKKQKLENETQTLYEVEYGEKH